MTSVRRIFFQLWSLLIFRRIGQRRRVSRYRDCSVRRVDLHLAVLWRRHTRKSSAGTFATLADVYQVSSSFNNNPATGLCGLAYKSIASTRQNPLHVNLQAQGQLAAAKFGFRLTRGTSTGAELTMGGIASDYASASFKTTPVTSKTYWEVGTNGMSVKNTVTGSSFPAAIDTGTTVSIGWIGHLGLR